MVLPTPPFFLSGDPLSTSTDGDWNGDRPSMTGPLSTMQSDYFRLKVRRIVAPAHVLTRKRLREDEDAPDDDDYGDGARAKPTLTPDTARARARVRVEAALRTTSPVTGKKARLFSSSGMPPPASSTALVTKPAGAVKPPPTAAAAAKDEDEALFARARAVRDAMGESISFYKDEMRKFDDQLRRSVSSSGSAHASPDVRLTGLASGASNAFRASTFSLSTTSANTPLKPTLHRSAASAQFDRNLPAYMFRESKFLPREEYGMTPEQRRELHAKRAGSATGSPSALPAPAPRVNGRPAGIASSGLFADARRAPVPAQKPGASAVEVVDIASNDDGTEDEFDEDGEEEIDEGEGSDGEYEDDGVSDESDDGFGGTNLAGGNSVEDAIEL
jgi:hypothetical protein